jgi:rhodanese-related sulfurtransferase
MTEAIDRERVRVLVNSGAQLLDVLPPKEYRASHIPGALNIPLAKLDRLSVQVLSPERDVIVYCFDYQ